MGYSSLCSSIHRNPSYNHTSGRGGERVCKITPHHMAVVWTGERCAQSFDVYGRNASAQYCIGYDGEIVGCVDENDRSWCSASGWNDRKAITIEVSNNSTGGDWPISQKSWDSLVRLCADICRRYGFRLTYDGTPNGSLTEHQMYAATNCPGPYLHARMGELARQVNAILDGEEKEERASIEAVKDGVYRLYDPYANRHHFTADHSEAQELVGAGWTLESTDMRIKDGVVQQYRLYNPNNGAHLITGSQGEAVELACNGWALEGYAFKTPTSGKKVIRLYNPNNGDHLYTPSEDEVSSCEKAGWHNEGVAYFVNE